MKYTKIIKDNQFNDYSQTIIQFPYELDIFQKQACYAIDNNKNVLVTAHTSAGKSTIAEYTIAKSIFLNKKVIYTSPIKTLSNQKYYDFKQKFGTDVGIMTGDNKVNPDANILIMTTEILRNMLYKDDDFLKEVFAVIFDEVHYINNRDRGKVWEESLVMLPQEIRLVMLSATISRPEEFSEWIGNLKKTEIYLISTTKRPVPLNHYVYYDNKIELVMGNENSFYTQKYDEFLSYYKKLKPNDLKDRGRYKKVIGNVVKFLKQKELFPTIFFTFSRKNCENYAGVINFDLITQDEGKTIDKIIRESFLGEKKKYLELGQVSETIKYLKRGIGIHHSGFIPILKEIVEILFSKGLIKILFATETFAVGVNMPTRCVVYTELSKYDGENDSKRILHTDEYLQMSGRAGRRGKDAVGYVVYAPVNEPEERHEIITMMKGAISNIESKFNITPAFILKALQYKGSSIQEFAKKTLFGTEFEQELNRVRKDFQKLNVEKENWENRMAVIGSKMIENLQKYLELEGMLEITKNTKRQKIRDEMSLIKNLPNFNDMMNDYKNFTKFNESFNNYEKKLKYYENYFIDKCAGTLKILNKLGMIFIDLDKIDINKDNSDKILSKGVACSEINEVNELLMIECLTRGVFNGLNEVEIITILSLFLDERDSNNFSFDETIFENDNIKNAGIKISDINNELANLCYKNNIEYNDNLTFGMLEATYLWASNKSVKETIEKLNTYEGNFIRSMLKISNMIMEIVKVCNIMELYDILSVIQNKDGLIVRDIVSHQSLYIN
jgi:superfamily II RNA helicase